MALKLITFATADFRQNAESLAKSALAHGFENATIFGPEDIRSTDFYRKHSTILDQKRGAGYWLWKPYLIHRCLLEADPSDILHYCDAGRNSYNNFDTFPTHLVQRVSKSDKGVLLGPSLPHLGALSVWTKRDCLELMDADHPSIYGRPLIMTWGYWRPTQFAMRLARKWLDQCCDPRCLTDMPNELVEANHADFRAHRHDQSILSILVAKEGAEHLDFSSNILQKLFYLRAYSSIAQNFHKRPANAEALLAGAGVSFLLKQHFVLKRLAKR